MTQKEYNEEIEKYKKEIEEYKKYDNGKNYENEISVLENVLKEINNEN